MGNFSRDTFDALKHYVGVRLQQGVPLVDADWNEAEDIRRHELRTFLKWFIGDGVPEGSDGFRIHATESRTDFRIAPGRCVVDGLEVVNDYDAEGSVNGAEFYSSQRLYNDPDLAAAWGVGPLPALADLGAEESGTVVYLDVWEREIGADEDSDLTHPAIGVETAVRHKREWVVRVGPQTLHPAPTGHVYYPLAAIQRGPQGFSVLDRRRTGLTLLSRHGDYIQGPLTVLGIGTDTARRARLDVRGGNWDPTLSEGDVRIGNVNTRLKIGVATGGAGAGDVRIRAQGGTNRLMLGGDTRDMLTVRPEGVGIGTVEPSVPLDVRGGNWDLTDREGNEGSEGDVRIGDASTRLKIGVATGGAGAGDVRIRAQGGTNRLMLGGGNRDMLTVREHAVGIDTTNPEATLHVGGANPSLFVGDALRAIGGGSDFPHTVIVGSRGHAVFRVNGGASIGGGIYVEGLVDANELRARSGRKDGYVSDFFINHDDDALERGDIVVLSNTEIEHHWATDNDIPIPEVDLTSEAYDGRVCGIVSHVITDDRVPYVHGIDQSPDETDDAVRTQGHGARVDDDHPLVGLTADSGEQQDLKEVGPHQLGSMVTLGAYSYCKVDADIAPIAIGDLLTTSETKGHAQKVLEPERAVGAIIGKALGPLDVGKGIIPVLVLLH